jgi:hypothetical protein
MFLSKTSSLVLKYRYGVFDTPLCKHMLKSGKWFINYNPNCIMFKNNNEFRVKNSYRHILKPGRFVRQLTSQVISDNKLLVDFNMENNCSEYTLLMHYCDDDLITCFILSKKKDQGYMEKYRDEDFSLSF